jgi:hypothetical protein
LPFPPTSIKGREGQPSQGLIKPNTYTKGLGLDTLSRLVCNPYYKQTLAREHDSFTLDVGYYSSEARTSINPVVSCANHPSPAHDRYKFIVWR